MSVGYVVDDVCDQMLIVCDMRRKNMCDSNTSNPSLRLGQALQIATIAVGLTVSSAEPAAKTLSPWWWPMFAHEPTMLEVSALQREWRGWCQHCSTGVTTERGC